MRIIPAGNRREFFCDREHNARVHVNRLAKTCSDDNVHKERRDGNSASESDGRVVESLALIAEAAIGKSRLQIA